MTVWLRPVLIACLVSMLSGAPQAWAYPLDAYSDTGINRLEAYRLAQEGAVQGRKLSSGAKLPSESIQLKLKQRGDFTIPPADSAFNAKIKSLLGADASRYGIAVLDLSDPDNPVYAAHNPNQLQNPGSVGKIIVALAWFQALADLYPKDLDERRRILKDTRIRANKFIIYDSHVVPFWNPGDTKVMKRPIHEGDEANLWTYFDWMCSSSSNAAAAMLMSHLVLLKHFGKQYPVSDEQAAAYFADTAKTELQRVFLDAIQTPITRNGMDLQALRQGSFFTREGKRRVPGTSSIATARELMRFLVLMEQGKLVDEFSSLEMKRLLYLTDRRIRYASSPALRDSAVYFKSGSLYSCKEEPGFECKKYHGNVRNYMNSAAVVETSDSTQSLHYMVVVLSNVLRQNSAVQHQTLGTRIHRLIQSQHKQSLTSRIKSIQHDPELREKAKNLRDAVMGEPTSGSSETSAVPQ